MYGARLESPLGRRVWRPSDCQPEQVVINTLVYLLQASGRGAKAAGYQRFRAEPGDKTIRKVSQWARLAPGWHQANSGSSCASPKQPASPSITILASAVSLLVCFQSAQSERASSDQRTNSIQVQLGGTMTLLGSLTGS